MSVHPDFECIFCSRHVMAGSDKCRDHHGYTAVIRRDEEIADLRIALARAEAERDSEAGRDYWCDTCARPSQSNEGGTCLACGDDLTHVSEIPRLRAEVARLTAEVEARPAITREDAAGWVRARESWRIEPELDDKRAWERVDAAIRAHGEPKR